MSFEIITSPREREEETLPVPDDVDPCSVILSYMYASEDRYLGSRVRKDSILISMNLLGLPQIKDAIEASRSFGTVAIIREGGTPSDAQPCNRERLFEITRERLSRL